MFRKITAFLSISFLVFVLSAQVKKNDETPADEKRSGVEKTDYKSMVQDVSRFISSISEKESLVAEKIKEAESEKDINWKVCLAPFLTQMKALSKSAEDIGSQIPDLITAEKYDDADNKFAILKGLADAASSALNDSESCVRQLTNVNAKTLTEKQVDKNKTGESKEDSVEDAVGSNFGNEFVADSDKSKVKESGLADAGGVENSDINSPTDSSGGESFETVEKPEIVSASPTE